MPDEIMTMRYRITRKVIIHHKFYMRLCVYTSPTSSYISKPDLWRPTPYILQDSCRPPSGRLAMSSGSRSHLDNLRIRSQY